VALMEGLAQTLVAAGHKVLVAADIPEALRTLGGARPLIAVVDRAELLRNDAALGLPLARGGALVEFHGDEADVAVLPYRIQRATLAKLQLPLERQRLVALVSNLERRALAAGRETPEEGRPNAGK